MQNMVSLFRFRNLLISLAVVAGLVVVVSLYAEPVLRISIIPDDPTFLVNREMNLLTGFLEQKIGMKVEYRPMRNGDALVESLLFKELDLVWIDGARLAQARSLSKDGVMPIAQREEDQLASPLSVGTPPGRAYSWAVRAGLDNGLRQKLTDAFLTMNADGGKGTAILVNQHTSRFVPALTDDKRIDGISLDGPVTEHTLQGRPFSR
jgi:ABC-type phosphate/phosphonate transport system substrate-binding protein